MRIPVFLPGLLAGVLALVGVASLARAQEGVPDGGGAGDAIAGEPVTTLSRLDALPGMPVLLPLIPGGARLDAILGPPEGWAPDRVPEVWIGDQLLRSSVYRLEGRLREDLARDAWLPLPLEWRAIPFAEARSGAGGGRDEDRADVAYWVLMVELPARPIGRELRIGGRAEGRGGQRLRINWLDPPPRATDIARLPLLEAPGDARRRLGDRLRREAIDPFRRWRCSIIADRFTPHALWGDAPALVVFDDPVVEAAARHAEVRARVAIENARRIDPDLAAALLSALTAVVQTSTGDLLPVWPSDESGTSEMIATLLEHQRDARRKRQAVDAWLGRIPDAIAWVVSDQGASGERPTVATIGIANLTDREVICSAAPEGRSATNATPLLPHRSTTLRTAVTPDPAEMASRVIARVGTKAYPLTVLSATPAAAPPGIELGPLLPDWSMVTWFGAGAPRVAIESAGSARLYAEPSDDEEGEDGAPSRRWRVFVECRRAPGAREGDAPSGAGADTVRIWIGPRTAAVAIIAVDERGGASIDLGAGPEPFEAEYRTRDDRWKAIVDLPAWMIPESGLLEIGLNRVDGRGVRSAWPRPAMPGQEDPGRLRIDLGGWSAVEDEPGP